MQTQQQKSQLKGELELRDDFPAPSHDSNIKLIWMKKGNGNPALTISLARISSCLS